MRRNLGISVVRAEYPCLELSTLSEKIRYIWKLGLCRVDPQSKELSKGPPELVQHFRSLHVLSLIWFGYISRLSHCGGGG